MAVWSNAVSLRILISGDDSHDGRPLYEAIVGAARKAKLAGAKVIQGISGYVGPAIFTRLGVASPTTCQWSSR